MEQNGLHDLAAPYALDALEEESARAFEVHLGTCPRCREEVASFRDTAAMLAYATDAPPLPASLESRILESARSERPRAAPLGPRWVLPAAAAAAAAVAGLGIWVAALSSSLDHERSARVDDTRIISILSENDSQHIPISGANGTLVVSPTRNAVLVVNGLNPAPAGQTYEAWIVTGKRADRAGLFKGGAGRTFAELTRSVPSNAIFGVTLEKAGGVDKPTGAMLIRARVRSA